MSLTIRTMTSYIDGVAMEYTTPGDIKSNGLSITHVIFIPEDGFSSEIQEFLTAANELLENALDVFEDAPNFVPRRPSEVDDE